MSAFPAILSLSALDGANGFRLNGVAAYDFSGRSVASAGDVNGDGFDDLIVGADRADPNGSYSGSSYVVFGKASGFAATINLSTLNGTTGFRLDGVAADDFSGRSVSSAGDVNGDGFDDLIVGAGSADPNGKSASGSSYVVFGKASGFAATINLSTLNGTSGFRLDGVSENEYSGYSVSLAGDVNGDGFDDLIVGAIGADPNGGNSGSSYVVFGKASGFAATINLSTLDGTTGFRLDGVATGDFSGRSVSAAGDVNGDGFDDLIVGAYAADPNGSGSGSSYVVFGKASGFAATINLSTLNGITGFRLDGVAADDRSGRSVSAAGDVNGDGFDDLIVGAYRADPSGNQSGSSYVVFGKNGFAATINLSTLNGTTGFRLDGVAANDYSGRPVSSAGDINGDGFGDLIVGAGSADPNGKSDSGSTYVVFGRASGFGTTLNLSTLNGTTGFRLDGVEAGDFSGRSVSSAGDVNGDGFDDLIVGAFGADPNGLSSGASYVVFGHATGVINRTGTAAAEFFTGGEFSDTLDGAAGDDRLAGNAGDDALLGGDGTDTLDGGADDDSIYGGAGNDTVLAGAGDDFVDGGSGGDTLYGQDGADTAFGGSGVDYIDGQNGSDAVYGESGADILHGGAGSDYLDGSDEGDTMFGEAGNDSMQGGDAADYMEGGIGADSLYGGAGADVMHGQDGSDYLDGSTEADTIYGESGDDALSGGEHADYLDGGDGNDTAMGGDGADYLTGGVGSDTLYGNAGADTVQGGNDNDYIDGATENDSLYGDAGADIMHGGDGADFLAGGTEGDTMYGEAGNDTLDGGAGNDYYAGGAGNDSFVFTAGFGSDIIGDFTRTGPNEDVVFFSTAVFANFAAMQAASTQSGSDVVIMAGADSLTIQNLTLAQLSASDFVFF